MNLLEKSRRLDTLLRDCQSLMVAYSGGVDSAYLAYAAHRCLGDRMLAVLADSPSLSRAHLQDAQTFAEEAGFPLRIVSTHELERADYARNDGARCFYCKDELFKVLGQLQQQLGFAHLAYGMNLDDLGDVRPGQRAALEHGVKAPLLEAELGKADIRNLARQAGLSVSEKPASACLASRVAHGSPVTAEVLSLVEQGEAILTRLGFQQFRVRLHEQIARIEIAREELPRALSLEMFDTLSRTFKELGFRYVTLDTEGYRMGSMNVAVKLR